MLTDTKAKEVPVRVSSLVALAWVSCAIVDSIFHLDQFALLAGALLIVYLALEFGRLDRAPAVLVLVALALFAFLFVQSELTHEILVQACRRGAFLGFFILSVSSLKEAAQRSDTVRDCGQIMVRQPPGRRYIWFSIGGALIGVLVNLGAVSLLTTMVRKSIDEDPNETDQRIRDIRLQRMSLAALRGFVTVPMWSPASVTIALMVTAFPTLRWIDVFPWGLALAALVMLVGWGLDRLSYAPRKVSQPENAQRQSLMPLVRLGLLILSLPVFASVLSHLIQVSGITGLLLIFPLAALAWLFVQNWHLGGLGAIRATGTVARQDMLPALSEARNEVVIFTCSGMIAIAALAIVDTAAIGPVLNGLGLAQNSILVATSALMVILTIIGLNPIVTATVFIETFANVEGLGISPLALALTIAFTWTISVLIGPMTTTTRMVSRILDLPPLTIAFGWNLRFGLICLGLFYVGLFVLL